MGACPLGRAALRAAPLGLLAALAFSAAPARAEGGPVAAAEPPAATFPAANGGDTPLGGTALSAPPDDSAPSHLDGADQVEASDYYVGVRYRGLIIPEFVLDSFIDGGKTVYVNGVGPEFKARSGSLEYTLSAWMAFYSLEPSAIKGLGNEEEAWEIVESDMKSVYLTADFLWHQPLTRGLDLIYGGGAGIGLIFGDLRRTQAYLTDGGEAGNPDDYQPCQAIAAPSDIYCDDANGHYGGYSEDSWGNGGAKPSLFPWLALQLGLRYQPHPKVSTHLDLGIGLSGFMLGVSADYGL